MDPFDNLLKKDGFTLKLWRGERMCLLGFDVDQPEPDLVGFSIECQSPGSPDFIPLRNRLAFAYDPAAGGVTGDRKFLSTQAPFQKFRWIHFPYNPQPGSYVYRATKIHMPQDGKLVAGTAIALPISLDPVTFPGYLDVGFTRNFASSQAYAETYGNNPNVIPNDPDAGLKFTRLPGDVYRWLGFEAYDLILQFVQEALDDPSIELDILAYDLNEGDIVERLRQLGPRLRIVVDDSTTRTKKGAVQGHGVAGSAESQAAAILAGSAGPDHVRRTHFQGLQHHKVMVARRAGQCFKVLAGSTNFSYRGLYIQANNVLVFQSAALAGLFGRMFDAAFNDPAHFNSDALSATWQDVVEADHPQVHVCFAPHKDPDTGLTKVGDAINQARSSVLYAVAFLNLIRSGPTQQAFANLTKSDVFSYGVADSAGGMNVMKPDGSVGLVDFGYLADHAPEPFKSEWGAGKGINIHHKFVVIDFNQPGAKVFTGSSNLAPGGEKGNGDHLLQIDDPRVATGYAIEALRVFDHLHFRSKMKEAQAAARGQKAPSVLALQKPSTLSGQPAWFAKYYQPDTAAARDRLLFSS